MDRDDKILALLDHATPRIGEAGDWDDVIRRAGPTGGVSRFLWRLAAITAVAVIAAVLAILFVQFDDDPAGQPSAEPGRRISVLDRPQRPDDRMEPSFLSASDWPIDTTTTRLAQTPEGGRLYLSLAKDGRLCLGLDHPKLAVFRCEPFSRFERDGAVSLALDEPTGVPPTLPPSPGGRFLLFGVVPDGVTSARAAGVTASVANNTYWLTTPKRDVPVELETGTGWRAIGQRVLQPRYSILERPRVAADRIPSGLGMGRGSSSGEPEGEPLLDEARLAVEREGVRYFVAPADNGNVCLITYDQLNLQAACRNPKTLANVDGFLILASFGQQTIRATIVPDGFTEASLGGVTTPIAGNVLAFPSNPPGGGEAEVTGPAGTATFEVPPLAPAPIGDTVPFPGVVEAKKRKIVEATVETGDRAAWWTAPRSSGGDVRWLDFIGPPLSFRCPGVPEAPAPGAAGGVISRYRASRGTAVILSGAAGRDVAEVEVRFEDGESLRVLPVEGVFVSAVSSAHTAEGRQPVRAIARDTAGNETWAGVVRVTDGPGANFFAEFADLPPATATPSATPPLPHGCP